MQQIGEQVSQIGIPVSVSFFQRFGGLDLVHALFLPPLHIYGADRYASPGGIAVGEGDGHRFSCQQRPFIRIKCPVGFRDGGDAFLQVVRHVQKFLPVFLVPGLRVPVLKGFS